MEKLKVRKRKKILKPLLLIFLINGFLAFGQAEEYSFSGKVTDSGNDAPIPGVSVFLEGTTYGGVTDFDGSYAFSATLDSEEYYLVASYLGYSTKRTSITMGASKEISTDISLSEDLLSLDEVVVTGNTVGVNKRTLGNAISSVKAEDLVDNGATAIDQAISGKTTGALVQQNSGDPAGGISIRLRGPSTVLGSSDPLYIVDGIIISNSSNQLVDLGGNAQNRLADLNPNDVERIEIIKGAAAAAIYGSRASNGVVQIFTKRGKSGKPRFNFSTNVKVNELRKKLITTRYPLRGKIRLIETILLRFQRHDMTFKNLFSVPVLELKTICR